MTDKQIIDEERMFKCVWCKYDFKESDTNFILSENPNECVCNRCMTEWVDNLLWDFKRKEQECEELNKQVEIFTRQLEKANREVIKEKEKNATQRQENEKLKQTIAKIKGICSEMNCESLMQNSWCGNTDFKMGCCEKVFKKQILQKISEDLNDD